MSSRHSTAGFTLIELLVTVIIAVTLAAIAIPAYNNYIEQMKVSQAKTTIARLSAEITKYYGTHDAYPSSLANLSPPAPLDPWGHPYKYLRIDGNPSATIGVVLKDRSLHPLNSDYDLYSMGENGKTTTALTSKVTQDDIIRAGNGGYIGLASNY